MFTIWHNSKCSKSRATLALLEENNITPKKRYYKEDIPSVPELKEICDILSVSPLDITRTKETIWEEENIDITNLSDEKILEALHQFPQGIERPIVIREENGKKTARIGRPPENILELF